ncbi:putative sensory box/GGDEF family protein [Rhizobium etli CFN 42]|uniref:Sensory box/GGDEF family protein n=1 Tax=Rhizobium etli (strain ATCC 51251 / DSM 11541 / JCM 21823 / NBRC 15573 / CFN 42) TaxID=347834 RepID=Q2K8P6_RHIEC|nr:sensor domain-containing diguanylate cyclase [Rhizobium etli]ABC90790.1 putative sensory box/GGDEF family protein [Rhizobium etli CFN 42]
MTKAPQKKTEIKLQDAREELEHRMRVTPAMLHSIDGQGRLISVSDAWLTKLGYTRDEVIGRRSSEFLTPESRLHAVTNVLPDFFRTGRCDDVQYQMVCKDGRIVDVQLSAVLEFDESIQESISLAVITDVTALKATKRQLAASEARYRELVESQSELVSLAREDGTLEFVNHAYARCHGKRPEDMVGASLFDFVPEDDYAEVARHLKAGCANGDCVDNENRILMPDGETRWFAWTNRALKDADGRVTVIHSVGRDIHERVMAEERLRESEARYRLLADHSTDMVFQLDRNLVRRYVSPACREILGYEPADLIGRSPAELIHPEDEPFVTLAFRALLDGTSERRSITNRIQHRDGHWIWAEAQLKALRNNLTGDSDGIIGTLRDVSSRKAIEDQLHQANTRLLALAEQDDLTGLSNRRCFDAALLREHNHARRDKRALALLMIDVDWFKPYNDLYGHPAGDECLKRVGAVIKDAARRPHDLAARYGGEEFVTLLPDTDVAGAMMVAERIREAVLDLRIEHGGSAFRVVSVSIGAISLDWTELNDSDNLLHQADRAVYQAKGAGRNKVICSGEGAGNRVAGSSAR